MLTTQLNAVVACREHAAAGQLYAAVAGMEALNLPMSNVRATHLQQLIDEQHLLKQLLASVTALRCSSVPAAHVDPGQCDAVSCSGRLASALPAKAPRPAALRSKPSGSGGSLPPRPPHAQGTTNPSLDPDLVAALERDVLDQSPGVRWSDVAGLHDAKRVLEEATVLPLLLPQLFVGIRRPARGVLLFGPPGTGKTLLARAVATECGCTFFSVSSASLASKYRGESERLVRALFDMARARAPSVVFIDEIDAVCSQRGAEGEHEASRRMKSELLVQIDGCHHQQQSGQPGEGAPEPSRPHVVVLAATNFPWHLDEALRRRLEKRVYIPLPGERERAELLALCLRCVDVEPGLDLTEVAARLAGYSGDDVAAVARDAAMNGARRAIGGRTAEQLRALAAAGGVVVEPVRSDDFEQAKARIKPSVAPSDVEKHEEWLRAHGSA